MGRPALAENVHRLRGTDRADRKRTPPQPVRGIPTAPSWLPTEGKAEWKRITPELDRLGLLSLVDRGVLSLYCDAWAKWTTAARQLGKEGLLAAGQKNVDRKHPAWQAYKESGAICITLQGKLGLNPADRQKMNAPELDDADDLLD